MPYIRQSTTHVRTHTGYKPLSCKQCYYECKQLTALTYERIHTNEKRFIQDARKAFTNMLGHSQEPTIYYSSKELCSTKILTSGSLKNPLMKAELHQVPIFSYNILIHFHRCNYLDYHDVLTSTYLKVYMHASLMHKTPTL